MPDLSELLVDLDEEYAETRGLVAALAPDDPRWDRPTPAAGWAVRDQISHLAFFDDAGRRAVEEPEEFAREAELAMASMAQAGDPMEPHLTRGRSMTGDQLLAWWEDAHTGLARALSGADPGLRLPWYGPPMGVLSFASARLMETWAHGQDVADALGVEHRASDRLRHVAHLGVRARPFSYAVHGRDVPAGRIDVILAGPSGGSWEWQAGEPVADRARLEDGAVEGDPERARPTPGVRGSALDFCLVVTQRRNIADTDLAIEGEEAAEWMSLAQAFAGPPGPGRPPLRGG